MTFVGIGALRVYVRPSSLKVNSIPNPSTGLYAIQMHF